jgi:hypothetical protein
MRYPQKIVAILGLLIALGFVGYAVWNSVFTGMSFIKITSDSEGLVEYTSYLETKELDATSNSIYEIDTVTIEDLNGDIDVEVEFAVTIDDEIDDCNNVGDVVVNVTPTSFSMSDGEVKDVNVTYTVKQWACPQNVTVDLNITSYPLE